MQRILTGPGRNRFRKRHVPGRFTTCSGKLTNGAKLFAISESQIAHVTIKRVDIDGFELGDNRLDFTFET
jgi:hypothetical protein